MLHAMRDIGGINYIRRSIGTVPELECYIDKWLQKRHAGYQVGYFGFHGDPGSLWLDGKHHVSLEDFEAMIDGRADGRVIHFGSCSVMRASASRGCASSESTPGHAPWSAIAKTSTVISSGPHSNSCCSKH